MFIDSFGLYSFVTAAAGIASASPRYSNRINPLCKSLIIYL